jgi:hypothetical protein
MNKHYKSWMKFRNKCVWWVTSTEVWRRYKWRQLANIKHTEHWSKSQSLGECCGESNDMSLMLQDARSDNGCSTHNGTHLAPVSIINPKSPWRTAFLTWPFLLRICRNTTRGHSRGCCCYCCCNWCWTSSRDDNRQLQKPRFKWTMSSKSEQVQNVM